MSIANELCSEVVNAVLMRQKDKGHADPEETIRMLLEFHRTLRGLHADERRRPIVTPEPGAQQAKTNSPCPRKITEVSKVRSSAFGRE